jgi:hypothetical protein
MFPPIVRKTFGLNRGFFLIFERLLASAQLIIACVTAYFILSVAADAQIVALGASDVAGWFGRIAPPDLAYTAGGNAESHRL